MRGDMFIFDNVVHMYDNTPDNVIDPTARDNLEKFHRRYSHEGEGMDQFRGRMDLDDALETLFTNSETDMALAQTVPLFGWWKEGFAPARLQHALAQAAPDRVLFCGGVDPLFQGVRGAVTEMERQVTEWGAVSMKFYKSHGPRLTWRVDDRELAYPLWEKALELGLTNVQFHCGGPLGKEPVEALRAVDIQAAAADFPELNFIIHHLGDPYIDETLNIAGRFDNVFLALSSTVVNIWPIAPWECYARMGKCLSKVGEDKLLWGSEAFIWPHLQMLIDIFGTMEIPAELQDRYGYPELTDTAKRKILGLNQARILGIDVKVKLKELYPDASDELLERASTAE